MNATEFKRERVQRTAASGVTDQDLAEVPELSEEEQEELKQRLKALDKLFEQEKRAKFKLELLFGKARSMHKPVPGCLSFWESGSQLHGGGDAKVYLCPGKLRRKNNCQSVIPFNLTAYGRLVCPNCKEVWKDEEVIGEILGRHTMRQWAELLYTYFRQLDYSCDIYLKHAPEDVRTMAMLEQERQRGGELLAKARKRALHVYPLINILQDTAGGADPLGRIYAFLTA